MSELASMDHCHDLVCRDAAHEIDRAAGREPTHPDCIGSIIDACLTCTRYPTYTVRTRLHWTQCLDIDGFYNSAHHIVHSRANNTADIHVLQWCPVVDEPPMETMVYIYQPDIGQYNQRSDWHEVIHQVYPLVYRYRFSPIQPVQTMFGFFTTLYHLNVGARYQLK